MMRKVAINHYKNKNTIDPNDAHDRFKTTFLIISRKEEEYSSHRVINKLLDVNCLSGGEVGKNISNGLTIR